jgi:uncharacterized membrane protein YsdA (DUF1294 family)/cold shock CspA family protein
MAFDVRSDYANQVRSASTNAPVAKLTARIVEWNVAKGYGFISFEKHRIFVHQRDFAVKHRRPEVGDLIEFVLGRDDKGRLCAQQAEHHNDGGRVRFWHLLALLPLLVAPGYALWQAGGRNDWRLVYGCAAGISLIAYLMYWLDKLRARHGEWRIAESTLHLVTLLGGWPGAFLAQRHFNHKTAKLRFNLLFWLIVTLHQFLAVDYLRDWTVARAANAEFMRLTMTTRK